MSQNLSRPLSPHVSIYRWQITNTLSILHRLTGVALSVGSGLIAAWLWAAAYNGAYFDRWQSFFQSNVGSVMLAGWSFCFFYHLANGIRHLFWDIGRGFELKQVRISGMFVVLFSIIATAWFWLSIMNQGASS
jgi:succinate dehydrogenase / fumarate reductase cytochrome b subunit